MADLEEKLQILVSMFGLICERRKVKDAAVNGRMENELTHRLREELRVSNTKRAYGKGGILVLVVEVMRLFQCCVAVRRRC